MESHLILNACFKFFLYISIGSIPVMPLNFASISFESPFDRDTVESCCKEIIHSVARALASKRNIELCFSGIGRLTIRDSRVKMKFYKDFINEMDSSGKLVDSMMNVSFFLLDGNNWESPGFNE